MRGFRGQTLDKTMNARKAGNRDRAADSAADWGIEPARTYETPFDCHASGAKVPMALIFCPLDSDWNAVSTWRRRKSTCSSGSMIGMPLWFGANEQPM